MNRLRKQIRQPLPHVLERFLSVPHFDDLLMIFIDLFNQHDAYGLNVDLINLYLDWLEIRVHVIHRWFISPKSGDSTTK